MRDGGWVFIRVPEASKLMNQSWGQLVMFDSLHSKLNENVAAASALLTGGEKPVTLELKRSLLEEQVDATWKNALTSNRMSKAADASRRAAQAARRNAAADIIQVNLAGLAGLRRAQKGDMWV